MKLEYLPDGSDDCPLIRVFDFRPEEVTRFLEGLTALAAGRRPSVALHEVPGIEPVAGCRLVLRSGSRNRGVVKQPDPAAFECILTPGGWDDVAGLVEPFADGTGGYQWLSTTGDARWLISKDGQW